jgi:steroid delta-isomerase
VATEDELIRATIERYQSTFSAGDREGWLALFAEDAALEDPVGSPPRQGRDDIAAFWDDVHRRADAITVRMVQGPAVCGDEAAWAFETVVQTGGQSVMISIIDLGSFDADGRIRRLRAFWDASGIRRA